MKKGLLNSEKYSSTIGVSNNKITEKIDEEDKNSEGDFDNDESGVGGDGAKQKRVKAFQTGGGGTGTVTKMKKNHLQKNILDQTKELCYEHSYLYKDFDSVFAKILSRFY